MYIIGDHMYKQNTLLLETEQVVIALPDVQARILNAEDGDFIVLGCDGIWDSLSSQSTVDLISNHIHEPGIKLSSVCEKVRRNIYFILLELFYCIGYINIQNRLLILQSTVRFSYSVNVSRLNVVQKVLIT